MEKFLTFVSSIRWQDAVDIVLNSYILFRLYVLFRGTNVIRVLIAIAFLWFFQRVSVSLGLIVTSWAIQGIIAVAALIIIVVFRNEIRSILQVRNLKAILWGVPRRALDTPVEIITESVFELARRRVGALLVLPGEEDLSEVVHGGVSWQGKISKEMVMSIFWPENPVHDGAAIIRGHQVTEVGAVMPLSRREDLPYYYGTRHRAAAGLAEQTDALVIAVSEERGQVSVAKGQDFKVVHDREALERILDAHAGVSSRQAGRSKKGILEMVAAAALSFIFMGGVWFSFTRGQDTLITMEVPIEYINREPAMEILETSRNTVDLELSGSGALIRSIRSDQIKVRLDLSGAVPGTKAFAVTPENVSLPPGILLKNIRPAAVEVVLDVLIRKELPVQVDWVGRLPEGRIITEAKLDPPRVQVSGVKQALERITTLYTEKVPVDHIEKSGSVSVKPVLNPSSLKIAGGSREKITVDFIVKERVQEP
jgi:diadenylate cyclase